MYTVNLKKPVNLKKRIRKPITCVCLSKTKVNLKKNWIEVFKMKIVKKIKLLNSRNIPENLANIPLIKGKTAQDIKDIIYHSSTIKELMDNLNRISIYKFYINGSYEEYLKLEYVDGCNNIHTLKIEFWGGNNNVYNLHFDLLVCRYLRGNIFTDTQKIKIRR